MEFNGNKPMYLQICDALNERILSKELVAESRIPSVRELGAELQVNPNTIMRSFEKLTAEGIIYNKRGVGYFVSPDAYDIVLKEQKEDFFGSWLPVLRRRMELLGISKEELYKEFGK